MVPKPFVLSAALLALSTPAMGQGLYQDIQREFADENQLQRDVRQYQYDVSTGHYLRAAADRARIQNDETNIRYDQSLVQNDLAYQGAVRPNYYNYGYQSQGLVAHPQYPGYFYYPSQPGQLYYYPTTQGVQAQAPASASFVGPPAPTYVGNPSNTVATNVPMANAAPATFNIAPPSKTIAVQISNPADSGVPINFTVDGSVYSVPSGFTQKLNATTTSVVEFDRGDLFGDGRYTLVDGGYEFRYAADRGWELYKLPSRPPVPMNASILRNAPPRNLASNAPPTGLAPTVATQPAPKDVAPPPPLPDPSTPR